MHVLLVSTLVATGLLATCLGHKPICLCPASRFCPYIPACPYGLKLGYSGSCHCCQDCVIPKGGQCPYYVQLPASTPIDSIHCEDGTECCNGICSDEVCKTDSTTESTTQTETVTSVT